MISKSKWQEIFLPSIYVYILYIHLIKKQNFFNPLDVQGSKNGSARTNQ